MEPIDLLVAFLSGGAAVKSAARRLTGTKRGRLEHEAPDDKPERRVSQTLAAHTGDDDEDNFLVWSLDELVEASESRKNSEDDEASESAAALSRSSSCYTAVSSSGEASPGRGEP